MSVEITEIWLAEETGISRERLRELREEKLSAADWRKGSRGQVVWEVSGLLRAVEALPDLASVFEKFDSAAEAVDGVSGKIGGGADGNDANPAVLEVSVADGAEASGEAPLVAFARLVPVGAKVRRKFRNPKLVEAVLETGEIIRVKVRESKNFIPGMAIRVLPPKVKGTPWRLEGRCPRWPGRF